MAELADAADSKSADPCGHGGSTPPPGTNPYKPLIFQLFIKSISSALTTDFRRPQGHFRYKFGYSPYQTFFERLARIAGFSATTGLLSFGSCSRSITVCAAVNRSAKLQSPRACRDSSRHKRRVNAGLRTIRERRVRCWPKYPQSGTKPVCCDMTEECRVSFNASPPAPESQLNFRAHKESHNPV